MLGFPDLPVLCCAVLYRSVLCRAVQSHAVLSIFVLVVQIAQALLSDPAVPFPLAASDSAAIAAGQS